MQSIRRSLQPKGLVLIQSNVEEVAMYMLDRFTRPRVANTCQMVTVNISGRQGETSESQSLDSRWLRDNPFMARSETEAVTVATGRKVWRCLLKSVWHQV